MQYSILEYSALSTDALAKMAHDVGAKPSDRPGKSEARRRSYLAGRAAIAALFDAQGIKGTIHPDPTFGYLTVSSQGGERIYVNLSHTESITVAVIGNSPVGVDIESLKRDASRVMSRVAQPDELCHPLDYPLQTPTGPVPFGISLWSAKEAFSKALGLGLKFGMQDLKVFIKGSAPYSANTRLKGPLGLLSPAILFFAYENYVIALCSEKDELLTVSSAGL